MKKFLTPLFLILFGLGMASCERDTALEDAGEEIGESLEDTTDAVEDEI
tara:strand:- start:164195 stop:164341 length:147 start_codon:yes stop_codon:yes gene_type:complete